MNIIKEIKSKHKLNTYRIAKKVGVTWQAVYLWEREVNKPIEENLKKLKVILND